jgi:hypothetical protein
MGPFQQAFFQGIGRGLGFCLVVLTAMLGYYAVTGHSLVTAAADTLRRCLM